MFKTKDEIRWQEQNEGNYLIFYNQDIFEGNDVAVRVLELCRNPQTPERLRLSLLEEYDVGEEALNTDLAQIISQFQEINILEEVSDEQ